MREIKFRAWDNKSKEWLLGYEYPNLGGFSMFGEIMLFKEWSGIINRFILQQKDRIPTDLILMQFIGLKDKNGKEIYEGDLMRWVFNNHDRMYQCYWSEIDCGFRWKLIKHNETMANDPELTFEFDNEDQYYNYIIETNQRHNGIDKFSEIIGNIYENPELLTHLK